MRRPGAQTPTQEPRSSDAFEPPSARLDLGRLESLLDLLRQKGVVALKTAELEVHLVPDATAPTAIVGARARVEEPADDPYMNPDTFGGRVPGFDGPAAARGRPAR